MKFAHFPLLLFLCLAAGGLLAQRKPPPAFSTHHKNITLGLLGSNLLVGLNYDVRLRPGRMDGPGVRAGFGGVRVSGFDGSGVRNGNVSLVSFPLEFNYVVGRRRSGLIAGVGLLPIYVTAAIEDYRGSGPIGGRAFNLAGGFATFGYRFQPLRTGVTFQFNWNPMLFRDSGLVAGWFGLGVGVGFK